MIVKTFKLKTGEEFIAELVQHTDIGDYVIEKPVILIKTSEDSHAFSPWVSTSKETEYLIDGKDVRFCVDCVDDLDNAYIQQFGAIATPPPPQIILE